MDFIVDVENKRLVSSFRSTRTSTPESAVFGDTPDISVRLVESNESGNEVPWRYVDLTGSSLRVAIGSPGGDATSGTFTLTFGANTTTALDYNATAADVDTALNALASMITAGGCTVTAVGAGYQVAFDTVGAQSLITSTTDSLFPATSAYIYEATTGDGSTNEVQVVTLEVDNAAYIELTTDISAPSATVTTVRDGVTDTTSELQRVEIDGDPYLGTWAVTVGGNTSAAISVSASLEDITTAIEGITGIGAGNVTVTGSTLDFTAQFDASLGNVGTAVIDVANLTGSVGKTGSLDLNTNQFLELLNGAASAQATLEIVKYDTGNSTSDTVYQGAITCVQDVIANTPVSTTPFPSYASASHTHTESDITDLGTATTLNADTSLVGNAWFLDDDTMAANDAEKVPSQQSVKAYVDATSGATQLSALSDVNTSTPTNKNVLIADGVDFESRALVEADISDIGAAVTLNADTSLTGNGWFLDEDTLVSDDASKVPSQQSVKAYVDTEITGLPGGDFLADGSVSMTGNLNINARSLEDANSNEYLSFEVGSAVAVNHLSVRNAATSTSPSLKAVGGDTNVDINLQAKGTGVVKLTGTGGLDIQNNKIMSLDKDLITPISNGTDSHISIACQGSTTNPEIGVVSTNTNQGITITPKGTGNVKLGNYKLDASQTVGSAQDDYVLFYDHIAGHISLGHVPTLADGASHGAAPQNITGDGTFDLDWRLGNFINFTFGAQNETWSGMSYPSSAGIFVLKMKQDSVGGRTLASWNSDFLWAGGTAPTLSTAANAVDVFTFYYDFQDGKFYGTYELNFS